MLVAYFDRINIAVAGPTISHALGLGKAEFGWVLSAFTFGYALLQIPGGALSDRFGSKPLLVIALVVWSVFTAVTGMAASLIALLAVRALFGAGEGLENGAQFKLIGDYFAPEERSRANAIFLSTLALGPAIATPLAAWILKARGWQELFFYFAAVGLVVAAVLYALLPRAESKTAPEGFSFPKEQGVWLCAVAYLLFNGAFWGFLSWIPSYLTESRNVTLNALGFVGAIPYLCGFLAMLGVGQLASSTFREKRPALLIGCFIGGAVCLAIALTSSSLTGTVIGLSGAAAFLYSTFGPFWGIAIDLAAPETRGGLTGFINFGGQIGGFVAQIAIGYLVGKSGSYGPGLGYMIASLLLAAIAAGFLQSLKPGLSPTPTG